MKSMLVKEYMSENLVVLYPHMDLLEAVSKLNARDVPGAPVVDRIGNLIGILVEKDCLNAVLNAVYFEERSGLVEEFMHTSVEVAEADDSLADVAKRLIQSGYRGLPVMDDNRLVGMINRSDVLRALLNFVGPD